MDANFRATKQPKTAEKSRKTCGPPKIYENDFAQVVAQINKNPNGKCGEGARGGRQLSCPRSSYNSCQKQKVFAWKGKGKGGEGRGEGPRLDGDQQTNHNNHTEIKLIKMRGPLARQATFKNINKN